MSKVFSLTLMRSDLYDAAGYAGAYLNLPASRDEIQDAMDRARIRDGHPPLVMGSQQGGAEICENLCPAITSAAGTSGNNQPVLFENHGIDSRYTGPHEVAPTMSARYGTGGNNVPLVSQPSVFLAGNVEDPSPGESYCIAGNIIDRQDHNGGNGIGVQRDISYTLNTADRHCVFSQQRSDEYSPNEVVSTQSARQYKDVRLPAAHRRHRTLCLSYDTLRRHEHFRFHPIRLRLFLYKAAVLRMEV